MHNHQGCCGGGCGCENAHGGEYPTCSHFQCFFKTLLIIGGLNWGLVGLGSFFNGNWNVVNLLLGRWPVAENIVYLLVGLSALGALVHICKLCKCSGDKHRMN